LERTLRIIDHFTSESIENGFNKIIFIQSKQNSSDVFTKMQQEKHLIIIVSIISMV
jgi:hypothetical protein